MIRYQDCCFSANLQHFVLKNEISATLMTRFVFFIISQDTCWWVWSKAMP
uniref:Uncharacterized protein n=1 Tax=Rhizophora mucronata TaxID=61149 RepID=A0A2P2JE55_RHIMU